MLTGAWMVANGRLLEGDPVTAAPHSAGPLLNVQWLADLIFHGFEALGGLPMVITGTAFVVSVTYALLLVAGLSASGHLRLSCVAVWLAYVLGASNLSPRPQTLAYPIFALFLLAVMRSEWRKDTRALWLTVVEVLVLLAFGYLAWSSIRAVVWWGLVIAPIVARLLGSLLPNRLDQAGTTRDKPVLNAAILIAIGCLAVVALPWFKSSISILPQEKRGLVSPDTPVAVGDYLRTHEPPSNGMLLNDQSWGGYLEWASWPEHPIFLDGRIELHPPQVWFDYLDIVFPSARWRTLLDQYHIGYLVLSKADEADLVADVRADAGWRLDYEDDHAVVFSRADASASPCSWRLSASKVHERCSKT